MAGLIGYSPDQRFRTGNKYLGADQRFTGIGIDYGATDALGKLLRKSSTTSYNKKKKEKGNGFHGLVLLFIV